jgi:tRNA(Ile)-lysidine synthase
MAPVKTFEDSTVPIVTRFLLDELLHTPGLVSAPSILLAFSGGLDSTVLLHLLHLLHRDGLLQGTLGAIHVHHGLQPLADSWLKHCEQISKQLSIPLLHKPVDASRLAQELGPEAAARKARYAAFEAALPAGGLLLQAHHVDDQAETILLHMLRGSGPKGLSGIPQRRQLGKGELVRPLLSCSRRQLHEHAIEHGLSWVEDPSNENLRFERNYLRHAIIPGLSSKWPAASENLARSAALCSDAQRLIDTLAAIDLQQVQGKQANQLCLDKLQTLSPERQRNVLHYWSCLCCKSLDVQEPPYKVLVEVVSSLISARPDSCPVVSWGAAGFRMEFHRHYQTLYLLQQQPVELPESLDWNLEAPLRLPGSLGTLEFVPGNTQNRKKCVVQAQVTVRFRTGGETIKLPGRPTRTLKNLMQESRVPVWQRKHIPLVYGNGQLLAVAGICLGEAWPDFIGQDGARIVWHGPILH